MCLLNCQYAKLLLALKHAHVMHRTGTVHLFFPLMHEGPANYPNCNSDCEVQQGLRCAIIVVHLMQEKLKHMLWLYSHKVLFMAHMIAHMVPHKALPSLFAEPSMVKMLKGKVPYRTVVESMYKDGLILAGICALCTVCSVY